MSAKTGMTYADAGVDIDAGNALVERIKPAAKRTARPGGQAASALHSGGGSSKKERSREDVALVLRLMASMLRDLEAINAGADRAVLANPLLTGDLEALARAYSGDRARTAFGAVDRALTALERNAGTKVVTEWLAVQM